MLPAWCRVRFPLVATLPRPGPNCSPNKKLVQQKNNIPVMFNMDMFQSTFLFVKKLCTRFQTTICVYLYMKFSESVDDVHEFQDLVHHGWSLHSWRHIDGIASFPCFELKENLERKHSRKQIWMKLMWEILFGEVSCMIKISHIFHSHLNKFPLPFGFNFGPSMWSISCWVSGFMISEAFPTRIFGLHLCGLSHGLFTGGIGFRRNEEMIPV